VYCGFQHIFLTGCKGGLWRLLVFDGTFRGVFDYCSDLGFHLFLAQVPFDAEMDCQTHRCYGKCAQDQKYKE